MYEQTKVKDKKMNFFSSIKNSIDELICEFGFNGLNDLLYSTFGHSIKKPILAIGVSLGALGTFLSEYIGLDPVVYLAFVILLIIEFFTGIKASIVEGKKIYSKRFGRVILKLIIYTALIGVIHSFKMRLDAPSIFGYEINIYAVIYYASLNLIVIQLILSVFENLSRLGFEETSKVFKVISKILSRYIDNISLNKKDSDDIDQDILNKT